MIGKRELGWSVEGCNGNFLLVCGERGTVQLIVFACNDVSELEVFPGCDKNVVMGVMINLDPIQYYVQKGKKYSTVDSNV